MKLLVTGGAGFIGSNFVHYALKEHPDWEITNLDKLTYAGNLENLKDIQDQPGYHFVKGDIADRKFVDKLLGQGFDVIVNFAAESHVDRSILDASPFIETNIKGTQILLEGARQYKLGRFIQVSTDEVYGSIDSGRFTEESTLSPNSPYSASKTAADLLCRAYFKTHRLPAIITRCTNNLGPYQFPEKLIPLVITNALEDKPVPVYGDGLNIRDWIFVVDHCRALDVVIQKGQPGEIYNIGGDNEKTNLELIRKLLELLDKPQGLIQFVTDRPAHDRRYALDCAKIATELGWKPAFSFEKALSATVDWYLKNESWWRSIKSGEYSKYYKKMYLER
ncbi:MAG: dTDP-glucose 4,6-dehydratase [Dehalococcoidia bacterium]|nr:MAG: dTDP-glucose 4,6-dehydratase [Dehalococcoidia bacterium]TEU16487.1 MAG: dTDP-glucose 4,6-dehydratase [Dehalococcoidia bacterium]